jgi:hypothetical protein
MTQIKRRGNGTNPRRHRQDIRAILEHVNRIRKTAEELNAAVKQRERALCDDQDGVIQQIYAVGLGLEAIRSRGAAEDEKRVTTTIRTASAQLNRLIRRIRKSLTQSLRIAGGR